MKPRKILAIDDLEESLDLYEALILKFIPDTICIRTVDGLTGVQMAQEQQPDIILVDAKLPGMDGFEVVQRLRSLELTATIPILMVSGVMTTPENRMSGFSSGADGYICKPFQTEEFIAEINVLLRIKSYEDRLLQSEQELEAELRKRTGDLSASEERFRILFDQSPDAVFVESVDHIVLAANQAACTLQGVTHDELIGMSALELVPENIRDQVHHDFSRLYEGSRGIIESEALKKDGTIVPVEIRANHITYNDNEAVILIVRDIEKRKKVENALETIASEVSPLTGFSFFYSLAEQLCLVLEVDFAVFSILEPDNPGKASTIAFCEKGSILENIEYFVSNTPCAKAIAAGSSTILEGVQEAFPEDAFLKEREIESYMGLALANPRDEPIGNLFIMDRTSIKHPQLAMSMLHIFGARVSAEYERIQSAEKIWESEERHRSLTDDVLDQSLVGLFILDENHTVVWANQVLSTYFQIDRSELIGHTFDTLVKDSIGSQFADPVKAREIILQADSSPAQNQTEFYLPKKPGRDELWLEYTNKPIRTGLYAGGAIKHFTDITRQKALQEQLLQSQKMEGIGRLAGGVAHDFNNLLTTILGFSQILLEDLEKNSPLRENVDEIIHAGQLAEKLTRQLLVFGRKQITQVKAVGINAVVSEMNGILHRTIGEDVELIPDLTAGLPPIEIDKGQLEQVIMNLCVNARDAMPDGGQLIIRTQQVTLTEADATNILNAVPGEYIYLVVADTGKGMAPDIIPNVFEPFFTTKEKDKGTGLGLSIVYEIVDQANGFIEIASVENQGTEIGVYFPRSEKSTPAPENKQVQTLPKGTETILVVEDEDTVRHLTVRILESLGYTVLTAEDGKQALEVYDADPELIDLVLSDVIMPRMGGRQLWEELSKRNADVNMVFTSGFTEDRIQHQGISPSESTLILKPYTKDEIALTIHNALHHRSDPLS